MELKPENRLDPTEFAATDEKGFVQFGDLERGSVQLVVTAPGYASATFSFVPAAGETQIRRVELTRVQ